MQLAFEFFGGPRDGERLAGTIEDGVVTEAGAFYRHTDGAQLGAKFWCTCEYTTIALRTLPWVEIEYLEQAGYQFRGHLYEIIERTAGHDGLLIARARYLCATE